MPMLDYDRNDIDRYRGVATAGADSVFSHETHVTESVSETPGTKHLRRILIAIVIGYARVPWSTWIYRSKSMPSVMWAASASTRTGCPARAAGAAT